MKPNHEEKLATKTHEEKKNHEAHCDCGPECKCGSDCKCGCNCGPDCQCGCKCCGKKCGLKLLGILLIFLAGMGFDSLLRCCGRCPMKHARAHAAMPAPHGPAHGMMPMFTDDAGNTIIIINTDGGAHHHGMKKMHFKGADADKMMHKKHFHGHGHGHNSPAPTDTPAAPDTADNAAE